MKRNSLSFSTTPRNSVDPDLLKLNTKIGATRRKKLEENYLAVLGLAPDSLQKFRAEKAGTKKKSVSDTSSLTKSSKTRKAGVGTAVTATAVAAAATSLASKGTRAAKPRINPSDYVSFEVARRWAHEAQLVEDQRYGEIWWREASTQSWFPKELPLAPHTLYRGEWKGWKDFLGYGVVREAEKEGR